MANIMLFKDETSVTQTKDIGRSKQFVLTSRRFVSLSKCTLMENIKVCA